MSAMGIRCVPPVIDQGEADFIVSFEVLEAARWLSYLKPDGQIVTNTQQIGPHAGSSARGRLNIRKTWWRR